MESKDAYEKDNKTHYFGKKFSKFREIGVVENS